MSLWTLWVLISLSLFVLTYELVRALSKLWENIENKLSKIENVLENVKDILTDIRDR
jgi:uncharacterized protein YoxC